MKDIALSKKEREFLLELKNEEKFTGREDMVGNILEGVFVGTVMTFGLLNPGVTRIIKQVDDVKRVRARKIERAVLNIHKKGYVSRKGNKYYLTSKGYVKLNQYKIKNLTIGVPKTWDGYFRVIMFDIPESKKYARNALNKKLKELHFLSLQHSVFIYPHECKEEFLEIGNFFGVEKDLVYLKTKEVSGYDRYVKEFKELEII